MGQSLNHGVGIGIASLREVERRRVMRWGTLGRLVATSPLLASWVRRRSPGVDGGPALGRDVPVFEIRLDGAELPLVRWTEATPSWQFEDHLVDSHSSLCSTQRAVTRR